MYRKEVASIQVIGIVIMVILIAAFVSVVSFNIEPGQPIADIVFNPNITSRELRVITASESEDWGNFEIKVDNEAIELPYGPVVAGQTIGIKGDEVKVRYKPSNTIVYAYNFNGQLYESDGSDGQDGPDEADGPIQFGVSKITPRTLKKDSTGSYITFHFSLPTGIYATDVNISTILLNGNVPVDDRSPVSPYNDAKSSELMVKFDRQGVTAIVSQGDNVELIVTGQLYDGTEFVSKDYIRVI